MGFWIVTLCSQMVPVFWTNSLLPHSGQNLAICVTKTHIIPQNKSPQTNQSYSKFKYFEQIFTKHVKNCDPLTLYTILIQHVK